LSERSTRMEQAHKPGTELDNRIAQLVGYQSMTTAMNPDGTFGHTPAFSTSWSGMQLVVEEMQRRGYDFRLRLYETIGGEWKYFARFEDGEEEYDAIGDSAPHAVALAALSALEGQAETKTKG